MDNYVSLSEYRDKFLSPTIFREDGFRFFFFSREESRMLDVEVTNVSTHGFWLMLGTEELFFPFSRFPWFKDAVIAKLTNVKRPQTHHLYWPDLDVDLAVESIRHPEKFPLVARSGT